MRNKLIKQWLLPLLTLSLFFSISPVYAYPAQRIVEDKGSYLEISYKECEEAFEGEGLELPTSILEVASYTGDGTYYKQQLSKEAKVIYQALEDNITTTYGGTASIQIPVEGSGLNTSNWKQAFYYAVDAFDTDHTDVFWIDWTKISMGGMTNQSGAFVELSLNKINSVTNYYVPASSSGLNYFGGNTPFTNAQSVQTAISAVEQKAQQCVALTKSYTSDYQKVKVIHDWLSENVDYDTNYFAQSLYSALIYGKAVCAGYVTAFDYIAHKAGIETIQVSGYGKTSDDSQESHAWNYVKLKGNWYGLDITWDDQLKKGSGKIYYDFFLSGSSTMPTSFYKISFNDSHVLKKYFNNSTAIFTYPQLSSVVYSPSPQSTAAPTAQPTATPTAKPTATPTAKPTATPTAKPTITPTAKPTITPTAIPTAAPSRMMGDINGDHNVDLDDVQIALKAALTIIQLEDITYADVNKDQEINLDDVQMILKAALTIIDLGGV